MNATKLLFCGGKLGTKYEICIDYHVMLAGVPEPMHWDVGTGPNIQTLFQSSGADWPNQIGLISSCTLAKLKDVNYLLFLRSWNHQEPQYEYLHFEIHKNYLVNWGLSSPIRNNISSKYCLVISEKSNIKYHPHKSWKNKISKYA